MQTIWNPITGEGEQKNQSAEKTATKIVISAIFRTRCKACFMLKRSYSSTLYLLQHFLPLQTIIYSLKIILKYILLVGKGDLVGIVSFVRASVVVVKNNIFIKKDEFIILLVLYCAVGFHPFASFSPEHSRVRNARIQLVN